ncbi:hypothetical protein I302_102608 [Kwoniella bestiolae CBS 10118]|uniref:RING-type domain-containing protein n=1 Tax=Kwoniella bestiolae CBS 10118 TaxID=1296100 RepID=A0A1B9GFG1_9TREE|nr:hypothetical protein I302_01295 [Kwoniella bestiolae CBS 10118]OCF29782.1 hypothetical protein I302_01295 [Kwoniella bestiolae CBS 10118]
MPPTTTSSIAPHRKAAASPFHKPAQSRKPSNRTKDLASKENQKGRDIPIKTEDGSHLVLQAQAPPPPVSEKKRKKRKRKSLEPSIAAVVEAKPSVESRINAMIEEERKPSDSKVLKMLNDLRAPPKGSPRSSPEPEVQVEDENESLPVGNGDEDVEMDPLGSITSKSLQSSDNIATTSSQRGRNPSPTKSPIILKKEKERLRKKKDKEARQAFVAEQKARVEEEALEAREKKEREELKKAAEDELEKVKSQIDEIRKEAEKLRGQNEEMHNRNHELKEEESRMKAKTEEEKKRRSDQELQKVREEKRRQKELQDQVEEAQNRLNEMKEKYESEKIDREKKEQLIEVMKKQTEESKKKNGESAVAIKNHENIKSAIAHALECPICLHTVDDPYVLSCGHIACRQCLVDYFRSPTALKHGYPDAITPETDLSFRTKVCHVCRSHVLRKPARLFFLRAVLEPLGLFQYDNLPPPGSEEVDPWENIFPADPYTYKLYDPTDDTTRCPECMGEIVDSVCQGCNLDFSEGSDVGEDEDLIDGEEESVRGSVLGDEDVIRFVDDMAEDDGDEDGSSSTSSSDEDGGEGTGTARSRRFRNAPPPPPPIGNLLNILEGLDDEAEDDDGSWGSSEEDEREPNSEDEYGGSFIDDGGEEDDEEGEEDVSMIDVEAAEGISGDESEDEVPVRRSRVRSRRTRTDPDEDSDSEDQPVFTGSRPRRGRSQAVVISDDESD